MCCRCTLGHSFTVVAFCCAAGCVCGWQSDFSALCEQADEQLFRTIKYKPTHPLQPLLPPERSTPYCTRPRLHNYKLPSKINDIDECNFIYRVLYKDCF